MQLCVLVARPNLLFHFDHAVTSDAVGEGDAVKGSARVLNVPNTHFNRVDANTPQLLPLTHTHRRKSAQHQLIGVSVLSRWRTLPLVTAI